MGALVFLVSIFLSKTKEQLNTIKTPFQINNTGDMSKRNSDNDLKQKSAREILDLLKEGMNGNSKSDPDRLDAMMSELASRDLSEAESLEFEKLMGGSAPIEETFQSKNKNMKSEETTNSEAIQTDENAETGKYLALKTVATLLSIIGFLVIAFGVIGLFYFVFEADVPFYGIMGLLVSVLIALPFLALSNLARVFIDIEYNTRKTREALTKK